MLRISLGNMPPLSSANLRAFCSQKLEFADESYCFRLPMTYVPAYLGNVSNLSRMHSAGHDSTSTLNDASIQEVIDVQSMPVKSRSSGLWDIEVQI